MDPDTDQDESEDLKRIYDAAVKLGEFFDNVSIFVSKHEQGEEGGTIHLNTGVGNFFARYGQVRDWMLREDERSRAKGREDQDE